MFVIFPCVFKTMCGCREIKNREACPARPCSEMRAGAVGGGGRCGVRRCFCAGATSTRAWISCLLGARWPSTNETGPGRCGRDAAARRPGSRAGRKAGGGSKAVASKAAAAVHVSAPVRDGGGFGERAAGLCVCVRLPAWFVVGSSRARPQRRSRALGALLTGGLGLILHFHRRKARGWSWASALTPGLGCWQRYLCSEGWSVGSPVPLSAQVSVPDPVPLRLPLQSRLPRASEHIKSRTLVQARSKRT